MMRKTQKKLVAQLQMNDGTYLNIYACARQRAVVWVAGMKIGKQAVQWHRNIIGGSADEAIAKMEARTVIDVQDGHLVIEVVDGKTNE